MYCFKQNMKQCYMDRKTQTYRQGRKVNESVSYNMGKIDQPRNCGIKTEHSVKDRPKQFSYYTICINKM